MHPFIHNLTQVPCEGLVYFFKVGGEPSKLSDRLKIYSDSSLKEEIKNPVPLDKYGRITTHVFTKEPHSYLIRREDGYIYARSDKNGS